jgi:peptide/nickel transport system substrate-binding protein
MLYVPPVTRPYLPDPAGLGLAIQSDLAAVGISVTLATPDWQTEWLPDVHGGRADLFLLGWTGVNGDPDSFLCPLFCGAEGAFNTGEAGEPLPPDAELASLLADAQAATDVERRAVLYAQAQARIFETVPAVPLAHRQSAWAYRIDVQGHVPSPIESVFFGLHYVP